MSKILALSIALAAVCAAQQCSTDSGATNNGEPVAASASFTVTDGSISVMVTNNISDPRSAAQLLNGVAFTLSTGQTVGTLSSSSAVIRTVSGTGSFTDGGPSATGWALASDLNGGLGLCVLCTDLGGVGPSHLLIGNPAGTGTYASANRSIRGNKPHNPFTAETAQFLISVPGLLSGATVTGVSFTFGTQAGAGVVGGSCGTVILPGIVH
jgi:hypothetical protein